jgi:xanthine/uracil permease
MSQKATHARTPHPVDEVLPAPKLALYGFQHVLAFYAGAVIVPILLAGAIHQTPTSVPEAGSPMATLSCPA